jgi:hypothetical protein
MTKNILYYPTIEFQADDYEWLWRSALLWDRIYRIVPDGYSLDEPDNIKEICSTEEIGIPLSPIIYNAEASANFIDNLNNWQAAALDFCQDDVDKFEEYSRLHKDKVDVRLRELMLLNEDAYEDAEWLRVPKKLSRVVSIIFRTIEEARG